MVANPPTQRERIAAMSDIWHVRAVDRAGAVIFDDLCYLLERLGFASRQQGTSHRTFKRGEGFVNLQEGSAGKAKPYQVRQARETLKRMKLRP